MDGILISMNAATALGLDAALQAAAGGAPFPDCPECGRASGTLKLTRFCGTARIKFVTCGHHLHLSPDEARGLPLKSWPPPYVRRYGPLREAEAALADAFADAVLAGDEQAAAHVVGLPVRIIGDRPQGARRTPPPSSG
ncbi:hypothetical protein ACFC7A_27010 [Streptomyces niveus]|uniref:hypothetical protein n=1 Tax=Streptomyces niveus TaxID=193462 RepID=UPI0035DFDE70